MKQSKNKDKSQKKLTQKETKPMAKMSELETPIPFPEGFNWYDEYRKAFKNIEGVILFDHLPSFYDDNSYYGVKYAFFGAIKFRTNKMQGNGVTIPKTYYKLFLALLIDPPEAKSLMKAALVTERDHYNYWKTNSNSDPSYSALKKDCHNHSIFLLEEMDILLLASLINELRKDN